ncbi:MAG TPA: sugar phosphate isomerase/epimerase family protein [Pirellulales bacterium]|nr:sugar phosphate isomerase/epimerase family protein [Pirellulales bacterium]
MLLGLVTYMWGAEWDLPTIIKNCELTGFKGVELRSGHKHGVEPTLSPADRKEVAKRFADSGVTLVGLGSACEYHSPDPAVLKKQIEDTKAFILLCHDCGGTGVKVRPNALPKEVPVQTTLEQIGNALNEVASFGEGYGVQIRLEVHGKGTSDVPNVKKIMDVASHPNAAVCWNCNPGDLDGLGLEGNFNLVKDRLGTIHIHDLISTYPWRELFGLLNEAKFDGWTLVEEGKQTSDPVRVMQYYRLLWETMA